MMTNNETLKSFNEVGVEAFIIACLGTLNAIPSIILLIMRRILPIPLPVWLVGIGNFLTFFGYVFCVLAVVLSICAYVDMVKHNKRGYYGFSIASTCVAILGPIAMIGIRSLILLL